MFHIEKRKPDTNIFAAQQVVQVTDVEKDPGLVHNLDYPTWLPFAAKTYKISPNIEDYILMVYPICPSDIPNRNGIGFPLQELTRFQPPPVSRMAYKAWTGTPLHYDHQNEVHEEAYGVILDSSLHKITGYGGGKLWKVMGLIGLDRKKRPQMAERVLDGDINTGSMGALADKFTCSVCGVEMTKDQSCHHLDPNSDIDWQEVRGAEGRRRIAFRNAHFLSPIEYSLVESPAWVPALSDHILMR